MDAKNKTAYTGRSAHLAVMSELTTRGYSVTIPEVDVGRDVLAFLNTKPGVTSLQVKSTECKRLKKPDTYSGVIDVPLPQLMFGGDLYYVFVFGLDEAWAEYIIISRECLNELRVKEDIGSEYAKGAKKHMKFVFSFSKTAVKCGGVNFENYRNVWTTLPNPPDVGEHDSLVVVTGQPVHTAAQTAVISKLLRMGCNVAVADVDKIIAFQDEEPGFTHIRVKGANGIPAGEPGAYIAEVELPLAELKFLSDLFYVFPFHFKERCADFVVIGRQRLVDLQLEKKVGTERVDVSTGKQYLKLAFCITRESVMCGGVDFDEYRDAWRSLPPLAVL